MKNTILMGLLGVITGFLTRGVDIDPSGSSNVSMFIPGLVFGFFFFVYFLILKYQKLSSKTFLSLCGWFVISIVTSFIAIFSAIMLTSMLIMVSELLSIFIAFFIAGGIGACLLTLGLGLFTEIQNKSIWKIIILGGILGAIGYAFSAFSELNFIYEWSLLFVIWQAGIGAAMGFYIFDAREVAIDTIGKSTLDKLLELNS